MTADQQLLERLLHPASRRAGFRDLVSNYAPPLYFLFRHLGLAHEPADELLSDLFVVFWKNMAKLRPSDRLPLVLFRKAFKAGFDVVGHDREALLRGVHYLQSSQRFEWKEIACITSLPTGAITFY
ncbi:MAG: hypothetical protein V4520_11690 [Bacteroidota bacterium]